MDTQKGGVGVTPVGLVLGGVSSVQFGAAIATTLFDDLGPAGTVLVRLAVAALVLMVLWRPRVRGLTREELRVAVLFGVVLGGMNLSFYAALDRIPLGVAVTLEFAGPLGVAVAGSRRALDVLWVVLAAAGIVLLSGGGGGADPLGEALALLAGGFWAGYILLSARAGRTFPGGSGLALAMVVGTVLLLPAGIAGGGSALLDPRLLATGAAVAVLSSVIPYSLELEALRRMPARVFGVLMSLEPGVAALAGWLVLAEALATREVLAIGLVVAASAGAALGARDGPALDPVPAPG
jgi:inner membrane transporter RhtA